MFPPPRGSRLPAHCALAFCPGQDYNVTKWNSPPSKSANHYEASGKECQAYCDADPNCCSWTYCPPGALASGEEVAADEEHNYFKQDASGHGIQGERCCLKNSIPSELSAPHWTGVAARAVDKNGAPTSQCAHSKPPPPRPVPPPAVIPYPGNEWTHPKIHQSPDCLHKGGWCVCATLDSPTACICAAGRCPPSPD